MKLDETMDAMFAEAQAKLPVEDRVATHEMCLDEYAGYKCTKEKGHSGHHISHGRLGTIINTWGAK